MAQPETPPAEAPEEAIAPAPAATPPIEDAGTALKAKPAQETRIAPRKVLTCRAKVLLQGGDSLPGKTVDISFTGISVVTPDPIPAGSICTVTLDTMIKGKSTPISLPAKVVYSSLGSKGFRIGFQFVRLSDSHVASLRELMGMPQAS